MLYLHSTMFLLILDLSDIDLLDNIIYIPLCFYLYDSRAALMLFSLSFTFHYVSTYTCSPFRVIVLCFLIYIPLCFYLYTKSRRASLRNYTFTFHYVSTYTELNRFRTILNLIYIPLCFYLYRRKGCQPGAIPGFTFHYVSTYTIDFHICSNVFIIIYIPLCFYLYVFVPVLVNVNIAIYIPLCFYLYAKEIAEYIIESNLHSTMFLLIRLVVMVYIPL